MEHLLVISEMHLFIAFIIGVVITALVTACFPGMRNDLRNLASQIPHWLEEGDCDKKVLEQFDGDFDAIKRNIRQCNNYNHLFIYQQDVDRFYERFTGKVPRVKLFEREKALQDEIKRRENIILPTWERSLGS